MKKLKRSGSHLSMENLGLDDDDEDDDNEKISDGEMNGDSKD